MMSGDNYGQRESGYVARGGVVYRDTLGDPEDAQFSDLAVWSDGRFTIEEEQARSAGELCDAGATDTFSFGPALLQEGQIYLHSEGQTTHLFSRNPRAALGMVEPLHYVFVVVDGRSDRNACVTFEELALFMQGLGVDTAYDLDGGGTACMVFNSRVVNNPTGDGVEYRERPVSDFVYIG